MVTEDRSTGSVILALQRATHVTLDALSRRLTHLKVTPGEVNVLANLAAGQPRTVSELSRQVGTPVTTMTSILDRLARRGLITRQTPESNRRTVVIGLTTPGRLVAEEARAAISELEMNMVGDFSPRQLAQLRQALERLSRSDHDDGPGRAV